jgi:hypothetical protein
MSHEGLLHGTDGGFMSNKIRVVYTRVEFYNTASDALASIEEYQDRGFEHKASVKTEVYKVLDLKPKD